MKSTSDLAELTRKLELNANHVTATVLRVRQLEATSEVQAHALRKLMTLVEGLTGEVAVLRDAVIELRNGQALPAFDPEQDRALNAAIEGLALRVANSRSPSVTTLDHEMIGAIALLAKRMRGAK